MSYEDHYHFCTTPIAFPDNQIANYEEEMNFLNGFAANKQDNSEELKELLKLHQEKLKIVEVHKDSILEIMTYYMRSIIEFTDEKNNLVEKIASLKAKLKTEEKE